MIESIFEPRTSIYINNKVIRYFFFLRRLLHYIVDISIILIKNIFLCYISKKILNPRDLFRDLAPSRLYLNHRQYYILVLKNLLSIIYLVFGISSI